MSSFTGCNGEVHVVPQIGEHGCKVVSVRKISKKTKFGIISWKITVAFEAGVIFLLV